MATSGALDTSNTYIKYKITITENSYSTSNNTSSVTVKVNFYRTNTGYTTYGTGTVYCTIDGTQYTASVTTSQKITNSGIDLFTKTLTIAHDSDGSKSLTVSAYISHSQFSSNSQSFTASLTTIARASSISSASAVTLGNACSVKWTPASSSFAYKLKFVIGSVSYTTGYISPGTTSAYTYTGYTMSIATWAPAITTATSAKCTVTLYTYSSSSSSSSIGSSSTTFTVTVPSSVVPTVSIGSTAEAASLPSGISVYVQSYSKVKVTFTGTSAYSSALSSYSVSVGSLSYSGTSLTSGSAKSVTSGIVTGSGTITVKVTVTDARGRSGSASKTITVYAYSAPAISSFKAQRVDENGKEDDGGNRVKITYNYSVSSVNSQNTCSMTIKYKQSTASGYSTQIASSSSLSGNTSITPEDEFDNQKGWDFQISITDKFNSAASTSSVSTIIVPISAYWNGTGLGLGKVAETGNCLDIAWKTRISSASRQLVVYNNTGSGTAGVFAESWSGQRVGCIVEDRGISEGVYNSIRGGWLIYEDTDTNNLYVGNSSTLNSIYIGSTSLPLYLRGSEISVSGSFNSLTVSGNITSGGASSTSAQRVYAYNSTARVSLSVTDGGNGGIYDWQHSKWLIYSNSSGTVTTASVLATQSLLSADDTVSTLASANFRNPEHEIITHISSHIYEVDGRQHVGLTVDEVEAALKAAGMNPDEYDITERWKDEDGNEVGAIRYEELIPIMLSEIQNLSSRLDALEEE